MEQNHALERIDDSRARIDLQGLSTGVVTAGPSLCTKKEGFPLRAPGKVVSRNDHKQAVYQGGRLK